MNLNKFKFLIIVGCTLSLLFISFYSYYFVPKCQDISTFLKTDVDQLNIACLTGNIRNLHINDNYLLFDLTRGSSMIKCILFNYSSNDLELLKIAISKNQEISLVGKVDTYNNALEFIIYKFRVV